MYFAYKNNHLRVVVVFDVEFFKCFLFLAPAQLFYSEATPIISRENANVNTFFKKTFLRF